MTTNSPPPSGYLQKLSTLPPETISRELTGIRSQRQQRATDRVREEQAKKGSLSLGSFIREAWSILEPGQPYVHGWHVDAIAEHLQAVTDGSIRQLLINVPPGSMKSLQTSVFWPAYEWGPLNRAELRYVSTSHSETFSTRDSRKMRDLVRSEWFQSLWPHVRLVREGETSFANDRHGFREAMPYTKMTGARGDRLIVDDPQAALEAESEADRKRALRTFRETVPLRINDAKTSAIVIIMQRLNDQDVSCAAIEAGYVHLMLPMEYEPERRCRTVLGFDKLGKPRIFQDPRSRDGDLLFPARFSREYVDEIKRTMGSYAVAGQLQQRPVPREGGLFKAAWFPPERYLTSAPANTIWCRHWDLAATEGESAAYTAGVKLGRTTDGRYIVGHVLRFRAGPGAVQERIVATARADGYGVTISIPQDPGAAGKVQAYELVKALAGFTAYSSPETGDKTQRATPVAVQAEIGNLFIMEGEWNAAFMDELLLFPGSKHKDQVDALAGAFARLTMVADVPLVLPMVGGRPNSVPGGLTRPHAW
jgi:predicted phage terminase large subunit-like protein